MKLIYQIRSFEQVLASYEGKIPLHRHLVTYYKQHKQMGSADRRWTSRYLYSFYRLGNAIPQQDTITRLAVADFLCSQTGSLVITEHLPQLAEHLLLPVQAKIKLVEDAYPDFKLEDVFAFREELSAEINKEAFLESFFVQPDLFIRIQEKDHLKITDELTEAGIPVRKVSNETLALPNGTKLENIVSQSLIYQVQDLSSQATGELFLPQPYDYWWDCCAASGGKSLLLSALEPKVQLMVSDLRETSLRNLDERFLAAGIKKYQKKTLDLLQNNDQVLHDYAFDGILLDAPCTGSGTWGRTPEMLVQFDETKVGYFSALQQSIAANVVKYLKKGKPLIYMTCSVFRKENEDVVAALLKELPLELVEMRVITGYQHKADSMFVARLLKT